MNLTSLQSSLDDVTTCSCRRPVHWITIAGTVCVRCSGRVGAGPAAKPSEQLSFLGAADE